MARYLIYNLTNYLDGVYFLGTTSSKKLAERLVGACTDMDEDYKHGDSVNYVALDNLDKYDPDDLLRYATEVWKGKAKKEEQ